MNLKDFTKADLYILKVLPTEYVLKLLYLVAFWAKIDFYNWIDFWWLFKNMSGAGSCTDII